MTSTAEDVLTGLTIRSQAFVDGAYVDAASGETFDCVSPSTGRVIASVAACDAEDVDRAVRGARAAFESGVWSRLAPKQRKRVLLRFSELIRERRRDRPVGAVDETRRRIGLASRLRRRGEAADGRDDDS